MSDVYDVVILGGGSAGYAAALRSAQLGQRVALIESDKVGGTCLHRGCIPTKALLQAAQTAETIDAASGFGILATLTGIDAAGIVDYSEGVVDRMYRGLTGLFATSGVDVITGWGQLSTEPLGVSVGGDVIRGSRVILATGATPITLGLPIDGERFLTSEHALKLTALPSSAIVLGGGVIGVEFASAWASLGVAVTIVEAQGRLLADQEPEISTALLRGLKQRGITVLLNSPMTAAEATDSGVEITAGEAKITADLCLVAVGRKADPAAAGAPALSVLPDLSTNLSRVYAAGDLAPGPQLAHRGFLHGYYLAELIAHLAGKHTARPTAPNDAMLPKVTYSNPEVVSVGLTKVQAQETGTATSATYHLTGNGKAQILAGAERVRGVLHVVTNQENQICGVHIIGEHVSELVGEANLLVNWAAEPADFDSLAHAHPSLGEAFGEIAWALAGKPLHMHP